MAFFTKGELEAHHKFKHVPKVAINCDICHASFLSKIGADDHKAVVHWGKRRICQFCDKKYTSLQQLKKHIKSSHQNDFSDSHK